MQKRKARRAGRNEQGIAALLLAWYDRERRELPWRSAPGEAPDPYRVWLSEIMLQQTTVKAVLPRYAAFLRRWPDVKALASAPSSARCSPPGPGSATTRGRAICMLAPAPWWSSMAAGSRQTRPSSASCRGSATIPPRPSRPSPSAKRATPVDGNIERVVARLFAVTTPLPEAKAEIRALAGTLTPRRARRFRASHDGSRRHDLHAAPSGLRTLSGAARLPRLCGGSCRDAALPRREA